MFLLIYVAGSSQYVPPLRAVGNFGELRILRGCDQRIFGVKVPWTSAGYSKDSKAF